MRHGYEIPSSNLWMLRSCRFERICSLLQQKQHFIRSSSHSWRKYTNFIVWNSWTERSRRAVNDSQYCSELTTFWFWFWLIDSESISDWSKCGQYSGERTPQRSSQGCGGGCGAPFWPMSGVPHRAFSSSRYLQNSGYSEISPTKLKQIFHFNCQSVEIVYVFDFQFSFWNIGLVEQDITPKLLCRSWDTRHTTHDGCRSHL